MAEQRRGRWQSARAPLAGAAIGCVAGCVAGAIFGGGKLVRIYDWTTEWNVDAPRSEVFRILNSPDEQQYWWPSMAVEKVAPLPGLPEGRSVTYRVIQAPRVRRLAPPFIITSSTVEVERDRRTRAIVTGDLAGVLETLLYDRPDGGTRIVFHWYTRVTNPLLNALGYIMEPAFRASHDHVMREGGAGLQAYFAARHGPEAATHAGMAVQSAGT